MNFTLKPDENGVIVTLMNVDENDVPALTDAEKQGFDPTELPFSKYYAYDRRIGFYVGKSNFDHAEHKGKRLSFEDYINIVSDGKMTVEGDELKVADASCKANDAEYDIDFIINRLNSIGKPKSLTDAHVAMSNAIFAIEKLTAAIDDADDSQKEVLHDAIDHAFELYNAADEILFSSEFVALNELSKQLKEYRNSMGELQGKLLSKYHENF